MLKETPIGAPIDRSQRHGSAVLLLLITLVIVGVMLALVFVDEQHHPLLLSLFLQATLDSPLPSYMPRGIAPLLALGTLLLCVLGSVLAMRKAVSIEPASVFR